MKLRQIDMCDFRQFYGLQTLKLSQDDDKNVTLVHAENGVGKTTLLNSVYWCLFGDVTPRFEQRSQLVNFEAVAEGKNEASVEVEFEFDGIIYQASRKYDRAESLSSFSVSEIDNGSHKALAAPETFINSVIPREMAKYFFFDGEHAESFAAEQNTTAGIAIRSMLGCDLAELGIKDLREVGGAYTRQMQKLPSDATVTALQEELASKEAAQARELETLGDLRKTVEQKKEQRALIREQLRRTAGAAEIQQLRDSLEASLETVRQELADEQARLVRWIGTSAIAVVGRKMTIETSNFIEAEAAGGGIPKPYNEIFIQGLLQKEQCICCRDLKPQTTEWAAVADMLVNAGSADGTTRIIRAAARLRQLREAATEAPRELEAIQGKISEKLERRRIIEQQLEQESKKLQNYKLEEVREREASLLALEKELETLARDIWKLEQSSEDRKGKIAGLADKLRTQTSKNARHKLVMDKRDLAFAAAEHLENKLGEYEVKARGDIEGEINKILQSVARRAYRFAFEDDFTMALYMEGIDGPVPKSGGENQLMSLAFTAALVDFARARLGATDEILSPGTVAPLVLDAPIGHLDKSYRAAAAGFLPSMASQILLLLSSGHTEGGALDALRPKIGRQYILVSENRGPRDGRGDDAIVIDGVSHARSLYNQERSRVRLELVGGHDA